MLKKQEEEKEKVKDEAYYTIKIEELGVKLKNLSLVDKNSSEEDGTYQIWSSRSDEEEMHHPTDGVLFAKYQGSLLDEKITREDFDDGGEGESAEEEEMFKGKCGWTHIRIDLHRFMMQNIYIIVIFVLLIVDSQYCLCKFK